MPCSLWCCLDVTIFFRLIRPELGISESILACEGILFILCWFSITGCALLEEPVVLVVQTSDENKEADKY